MQIETATSKLTLPCMPVNIQQGSGVLKNLCHPRTLNSIEALKTLLYDHI